VRRAASRAGKRLIPVHWLRTFGADQLPRTEQYDAGLVLAVAKKDADEEAGEEELDWRGEAAAPVPAAKPVAREELATAWPREAQDVFEVRTRSRDRTRDGGIERSAHGAEEQDGGDARTDLEGAVRDVLVRYPIARKVKEQPERQRYAP
jgi:hypothetical protein